jgi:hypothetical protein
VLKAIRSIWFRPNKNLRGDGIENIYQQRNFDLHFGGKGGLGKKYLTLEGEGKRVVFEKFVYKKYRVPYRYGTITGIVYLEMRISLFLIAVLKSSTLSVRDNST